LTLFYGYNISTPLHVAATLPDVGERVFVIGTPLGYGQTVSDGIVSAVRNIEPYGQVIQITAPISPGSSGSPVFNMRGEVIGVAISQVVDGQNLNFAIPAERIQSLSQIDIREVFLDERSNRHEATKAALTEDDVGYSLCHEQGKRQEGIKHFQHAVQLSPSFAFAWYHLGECQQDLGQHEAAIKSYETASRVYPAFFNSLYSAGATYYELHRYTEAIESFEKANQARPCCLMELPAYDRIGAIYAELKRYDEAVAAYAALADTYAIQGLAPSAVRYYKKAIRLKPDHAYAHYMLGRLYSDDGDKAAALDEYKILMNLDHDLTAKLFDEIYK
jgi:tetratricopeptide (TPR) repeat protein